MTDLLKEMLIWVLKKLLIITTGLPNLIEKLSNYNATSPLVESIQSGLIPVAVALLTLFFLLEFVSKCVNPDWITLPNICMFFIKAITFKSVIINSASVLEFIFKMSINIFGLLLSETYAFETDIGIETIITIVKDVDSGISGVLALTFYGLFIVILAIILLGTVTVIYGALIGRIVELKLFQAIAPIPLATLVSDGASSIGKRFLQTYASICLQNTIILLTVIIVTDLTHLIIDSDMFQDIKVIGFLVAYICLAGMVGKSGSISKSITGL